MGDVENEYNTLEIVLVGKENNGHEQEKRVDKRLEREDSSLYVESNK
jgi:hypothetical protein